MNKLPERLICQATFNGDPVAGIMLRAGFGVTSKNSYRFYFGPTNQDGCAVLTRKEIIEQATDILNFSLMDYHPLEKVFDGNICYGALGGDEIKRAIDAYDQFHEHIDYPKNYKEKLTESFANPLSKKSDEIKVTWLK